MRQTKVEFNFTYCDGCDYTYETYYPCHNGSDCCDNDYCRCGEINDARVTSAPTTEGFLHTIEKVYPMESNLDKYAFERLATLQGAWDINKFSVRVCGGYYGQEIDGVFFDNMDALEQSLQEYLKLKTNRARVEYVLIAEYGHLPAAENRLWRVKKLKRSDIRIGNEVYQKKLDKVSRYENYSLPKGVCLQNGDEYRLIDGYHRLFASAEDEFNMIVGK